MLSPARHLVRAASLLGVCMAIVGAISVPSDAADAAPTAAPGPVAHRSTGVEREALAPPDRPRPTLEARAASTERGEAIGRALLVARLVAAGGTLALVAIGLRLSRRGRGRAGRRARGIALVGLALLAFAASYNFFVWRHADGIHTHEFFHYYLGAKYFPELGYTDLYECAIAAVTEGRPAEASRSVEIRDLANVERRRRIVPARSLDDCRARFEPARWAAFRRDALYLKSRLAPERFARILTDQGLNASPVWLLAGRTMSEWVPAEPDALRAYARADLLLLALGFAAVGWAFGWEGACLAVVAWAANPLSRYEWVGDAPLRQAWFSAFLIGVSLLRRGRYGVSSLFMAASALLRVFPLFFSVTLALRHLQRWIATRRVDRDFVRFVAVGLVGGLLLIALSIPVAGRGVGVLEEFGDNMSSYATLKGRNSMGLRALLSHDPSPPAPRLVDGALVRVEADRIAQNRRTFESRQPLYWGGVALLGVLLWRALARAEDWEAACLGFVLVLAFTQAAGYYMTITVAAALLGTRRARIAIGLLGALVAWSAIQLAWGDTANAYALASGVALLLAVQVMLEMRRPPDATRAAPPVPAD